MDVGNLRAALKAHGAFRSLLGVRLTGQCADGLMQAGLVGVVLFAPERAASPTRIAVGFAVLLLPFTLLAPVAAVLLDRWPRVAVLRWSNGAKAALIAVTAIATATHSTEVVIFGSALVAIALNRLVLAALGASLPRTLPPDLLVTGNALSPTLGTFVTVIGGGIGLGLRGFLDTTGDAAPFVVASLGYLAAAFLTGAFTPRQLGPERVRHHGSAVRRAWLDVRSGAAHISETGPARRALIVTTFQRVLFGGMTVWTIVVIRFVLHGTRADEEHALAALGSIALAVGIGLVLASLWTPSLVRHQGPQTTAVVAMAVAMSGCAVPLLSFRLGSLIITWLLVSLGAQVLKISVDTTLQRSAPDELRGRVFIAYDVVFNLAFVFGVAIVAGLSLDVLDGVLLPTLIAAGYLAVAFVVRLSSAPQWEA